MVRHTLKILQQMLQDFLSVSDPFGALCIKELTFLILLIRQCQRWIRLLKDQQIEIAETPNFNFRGYAFIKVIPFSIIIIIIIIIIILLVSHL